MILRYKNYTLKDGQDREIGIQLVMSILNVSRSRVLQLEHPSNPNAPTLAPLYKSGGRKHNRYSLRMTIEYAIATKRNTTASRTLSIKRANAARQRKSLKGKLYV
jgi:hypothetical protein